MFSKNKAPSRLILPGLLAGCHRDMYVRISMVFPRDACFPTHISLKQ